MQHFEIAALGFSQAAFHPDDIEPTAPSYFYAASDWIRMM